MIEGNAIIYTFHPTAVRLLRVLLSLYSAEASQLAAVASGRKWYVCIYGRCTQICSRGFI